MIDNEKSEVRPSGVCSIVEDFCPYIDANCAECSLHIAYQRVKEDVCRMYERWENEHDGE